MYSEFFDFNDMRLQQMTKEVLKDAITGKRDSFIECVTVLLDQNPYLMEEYARNYANKIQTYAHMWGIKNLTKVLGTLSMKTLALYEIFDNIVCVGLDLEQDFKRSLYTNNFSVLTALSNAGLLKTDLDELAEKYAVKRRRMLREGLFCIIRLDIANLDEEGIVQFEAKLPNYMPIIGKQRFFLTPVQSYYDFERFLLTNKVPIRFHYTDLTTGVEKALIATLAPEVLQDAYPPTEHRTSRLSQIDAIGFNPFTCSINVWDLESSKFDSGVRQLRLEYLSRMEVVPKDIIDTNLFELGVEVKLYFNKKVLKLTYEELASLTLPQGLLDNNVEDGIRLSARESVSTYGNSLSTKRLYYFMLANSNVFGNVQTELKVIRSKYTELYRGVVVDLPHDIQSRVSTLTQLAETGIVEFMYQNKKGQLSKKRMTRNSDILALLLNPFYVRKFESVLERLKTLLRILADTSEDVATFEYREHLLHLYKLDNEVDQNIYYTYGMVDLVEYLHELIQQHRVSIQTYVQGVSPLVSLKSLQATNAYSFIQSINTEGIVSSITHYPIADIVKVISVQ